MSLRDSKQDHSVVDKLPDRRPAAASGPAAESAAGDHKSAVLASDKLRRELGGPEGPDPTRYGDWERKGRCIDF
jgi:hypothetical protein